MKIRNKQEPLKLSIILITYLLCISCSPKKTILIEGNTSVINKLDLLSQYPDGKKNWSIKSNMANFNSQNKNIQSNNPQGYIYKNNHKQYKLNSRNISVIDEGSTIIMDGNVIVEDLTESNMKIKGEYIEWDTENSIIKFKGTTLISLNNTISQDENIYRINIESKDPIWNTKNGEILSQGPVKANSITENIDDYVILTAQSLKGNTLKSFIDLIKCKLISGKTIASNSDICTILYSYPRTYSNISKDNITVRSKATIYLSSEKKDLVNTKLYIYNKTNSLKVE